MPRVGFESMIPPSEEAKTVHALDRSATVTGYLQFMRQCRRYFKVYIVEFYDNQCVINFEIYLARIYCSQIIGTVL
jgi:hypothetical protein